MNEVIDFTKHQVRRETPESIAESVLSEAHLEFCIRRQEMVDAFRMWLGERPLSGDVALEVDGTANTLRLLVDVLPNPLGDA